MPTAEEKDAEAYKSTSAMVRENEQRHQELRKVLMETIIDELDANRHLSVELIHAYNGMPRMG